MSRLVHLKGRWLALLESTKRAYQKVRFGDITETIKSIDGGVPSEIEFRGRGGKLIGYWAYGYYQPGMPYQG